MTIIEREAPKQEPPVEPSETARILMDAAVVLRRDGWMQGGWGDETGGVCAWGAIGTAVGAYVQPKMGCIVWPGSDDPGAVDRAHAAAVQLAASLGIGGGSIGGWNDTPGRTREQVVEALERAALEA